MYVATLLCKPQDRILTQDLANSIAAELSAERTEWLADQVCVDLYFSQEASGFEELWLELQQARIDFCIQPTKGRCKRILLTDMDSTMIEQECIDELAAEAGVGKQVAQITAQAMNGEMDFEAALSKRVGLLQGLPVSVIDDVLKNRITLMPGGRELVATMRTNGAYTALVSGGFTDFTSAIAARLGFDEHKANTLLRKNGKLTGAHALPVLGKQSKVDALNDIVAAKGLSNEDVLAVGDGANDIGMLHLAGSGVALHAKPVVAKAVSLRLNYADLTGLLYLQGYKRSEFADL